MPIKKYFKGKGRSVLQKMLNRYGKKAGERIFYATANKHGMTPKKRGRKSQKKN